MASAELRINRLGAFHAAQLQHLLGNRESTIESPTVIEGAHGEIGTISMLLALSPAVIGVLGVWLAKARKREDVQFEFERRLPDGTWEKMNLTLSRKESLEPDASLLKQLAKMTGQSTDTIKNAIESQLAAK